jgi:hypothetical protein
MTDDGTVPLARVAGRQGPLEWDDVIGPAPDTPPASAPAPAAALPPDLLARAGAIFRRRLADDDWAGVTDYCVMYAGEQALAAALAAVGGPTPALQADPVPLLATLLAAGADLGCGDLTPSPALAVPPPPPAPSDFPRIVDLAAFLQENLPEPPEVIKGLLHKGSKLIYGSTSKGMKTWVLSDMCLSVGLGEPWLGFETTRGRVLCVNCELQPFAAQRRMAAIAADRRLTVPAGWISVWNLRGHTKPLPILLPELLRQIEGEAYDLILLDPIYKLLDGRDENSAGDVGALCGELEAVAQQTHAAVVWAGHYAKGSASGKAALDRVSGSGVWSRDADTVVTATPHQDELAFAIECTCRNFPPPRPFAVRWRCPRMVSADDLDPADLHGGRPAEHSPDEILHRLTEPLTTAAWAKVCREEDGLSKTTFYRLQKQALAAGQLVRQGNTWARK